MVLHQGFLLPIHSYDFSPCSPQSRTSSTHHGSWLERERGSGCVSKVAAADDTNKRQAAIQQLALSSLLPLSRSHFLSLTYTHTHSLILFGRRKRVSHSDTRTQTVRLRIAVAAVTAVLELTTPVDDASASAHSLGYGHMRRWL